MEAYFPFFGNQMSTKKPSQRPRLQSLNSRTTNDSCDSTIMNSDRENSSEITNTLLGTLSDPTNPITHSNIADRTDHYVSFATGHQVAAEHVDQRTYMINRDDKLKTQREVFKSTGEQSNIEIFKGVKVYINGYLESTTDIGVKRVVIQCGGQVVMASRCTHIITSRCLSGSKTHKILTGKGRVYVVKPEWVFESQSHGKRRPERLYPIPRLRQES